jgi:hypothetical protein
VAIIFGFIFGRLQQSQHPGTELAARHGVEGGIDGPSASGSNAIGIQPPEASAYRNDPGNRQPSPPLGYSNIPFIYQPWYAFRGTRNDITSQDDCVVHIVKVLKKVIFHGSSCYRELG